MNQILNRIKKQKKLVSALKFQVFFSVLGVITVFVFSWGVSNTGTAIRHRDKLITFFAVALALSSKSESHPYAYGFTLDQTKSSYIKKKRQ